MMVVSWKIWSIVYNVVLSHATVLCVESLELLQQQSIGVNSIEVGSGVIDWVVHDLVPAEYCHALLGVHAVQRIP